MFISTPLRLPALAHAGDGELMTGDANASSALPSTTLCLPELEGEAVPDSSALSGASNGLSSMDSAVPHQAHSNPGAGSQPPAKKKMKSAKAIGKKKAAAHNSPTKRDAAQRSGKAALKKEDVVLRKVGSVEAAKKESIPLSDVTWKNISSLGIHRAPIKRWDKSRVEKAFDNHLSALGEDDPDSELHKVNEKWREISGAMLSFFKTWIAKANPQCEFYARSFIDQFVRYLSELPGERVRFFQGYTVSAASQKSDNALRERVSNPGLKAQLENPVALTHNDFSLTVTGHVDYAVYTMPSKDEINFNGVPAKIPSCLDKSIIELNLTERPDVLLFPIEAKAQEGNLEGELPQVVAQALVILKKTGRRYTPWCLSNGCEWIFGVMCLHPTNSGLPKPRYHAFTIEPLWDKTSGPYDFANRGSDQENMAFDHLSSQAKVVWWSLNLWAFVDPERLVTDVLLAEA